MWIWNQNRTELFQTDTCREIAIVDSFEIVIAYRDIEKKYEPLGEYARAAETQKVFQGIVDALRDGRTLFSMPEASEC